MAFRFQRDESVAQGVKRIVGEQLDEAISELRNDQLDRHEAVHQVRKRFKKIRGVIRLVRPSFEKIYQRENAWFRDAGRELAKVRDAQSLIEAFDRLTREENSDQAPAQFAAIRERLVARRQQIAIEQTDLNAQLEELAQAIEQAQERVTGWEFKQKGFDAIAGGFQQTYDRAQAALKRTSRKHPSAEDFHEFRKQAKYHWYHLRLLENLWKPLMKACRQQAKRLSELLGDDHDLALLEELLSERPEEFGEPSNVEAFRERIRTAREAVQAQALWLGGRLFAEKSKPLSRRFEVWWTTWRNAA